MIVFKCFQLSHIFQGFFVVMTEYLAYHKFISYTLAFLVSNYYSISQILEFIGKWLISPFTTRKPQESVEVTFPRLSNESLPELELNPITHSYLGSTFIPCSKIHGENTVYHHHFSLESLE